MTDTASHNVDQAYDDEALARFLHEAGEGLAKISNISFELAKQGVKATDLRFRLSQGNNQLVRDLLSNSRVVTKTNQDDGTVEEEVYGQGEGDISGIPGNVAITISPQINLLEELKTITDAIFAALEKLMKMCNTNFLVSALLKLDPTLHKHTLEGYGKDLRWFVIALAAVTVGTSITADVATIGWLEDKAPGVPLPAVDIGYLILFYQLVSTKGTSSWQAAVSLYEVVIPRLPIQMNMVRSIFEPEHYGKTTFFATSTSFGTTLVLTRIFAEPILRLLQRAAIKQLKRSANRRSNLHRLAALFLAAKGVELQGKHTMVQLINKKAGRQGLGHAMVLSNIQDRGFNIAGMAQSVAGRREEPENVDEATKSDDLDVAILIAIVYNVMSSRSEGLLVGSILGATGILIQAYRNKGSPGVTGQESTRRTDGISNGILLVYVPIGLMLFIFGKDVFKNEAIRAGTMVFVTVVPLLIGRYFTPYTKKVARPLSKYLVKPLLVKPVSWVLVFAGKLIQRVLKRIASFIYELSSRDMKIKFDHILEAFEEIFGDDDLVLELITETESVHENLDEGNNVLQTASADITDAVREVEQAVDGAELQNEDIDPASAEVLQTAFEAIGNILGTEASETIEQAVEDLDLENDDDDPASDEVAQSGTKADGAKVRKD